MLTSKTSNKSYVGYTMGSFEKRFNKHIQNALAGVDTHLYRAIRKYGIQDFICHILWENVDGSKHEAKLKEIEMIKEYKTYEQGYNMTKGGDGGWTWGTNTDAILTQRKIQGVSVGSNNGRWCGKTDEEILVIAMNIVLENNGLWSREKWQTACKLYNIPLSFSKNRFKGSEKYFKQLLLEMLQKNGHDVSNLNYKRTQKHKEKLSERNKGLMWFTNRITGEIIRTTIQMDPQTWIRGRKNVKN